MVMPTNRIIPYQFVVPFTNVAITGSSIISLDTKDIYDGQSSHTLVTRVDYTVVKSNGFTVSLPEGRYYAKIDFANGVTYYSEVFTLVSNISDYVKIQYWNDDILVYNGGEINYEDEFKFEMYLCTTIGKPEYSFEEEVTKRLGYKFPELQVSNKLYKFTCIGPEYLCDAMRLIRLSDYIKIVSKDDSYNALTFSYDAKWETQGDLASIEVEFETDTIIQKLSSFNRGQREGFYNALLVDINEALLFDENTVALYYDEYRSSTRAVDVEGKLIRELELITEVGENSQIVVDTGQGPAVRMNLYELIKNFIKRDSNEIIEGLWTFKTAEPIATPEQAAASEPRQEQTGPAIPEPGDVVVSFDKINELMAEKRQNARAEVEKSETPETPEAAAPGETPQPANTEEPKKPRRGRPPKAEKAATENQKAEKSAGARKGRPPKADKAAPDKPKPSKRDKVSRSDGKAPDAKEPIKPAQDTALKETAAVEQTAPEPTTPPRPVEEGKLVYLKLSEVHPFHTFRPHPFKVRDDAKMQEIVASIRVNGVMVPGLARPEKDGNGYEIVAGHRRTHGSELAGLEEMPFIVREMTDHEAVQAMKDSNKQRDGMLPSELAALLELEVEDIKHQGGRLKGVAEGDVGKRSVEIVGEAHEMNYKKVMRYLRLNSLVPELLDKVDDKKMGFMPAVELSYIKPKNQRLIAVSIDGEQASPSLAQAKRLRELDKEGKLNGDVIDGILSEQKKEDRGVIISTAELEKYFGKEVTPAKMKEQIMSLLDDWKEKQPPELAKAPKKQELDK